ncbi:BAHD acyltransferase BIA1-like [Prosopis cineraria]|uniref:BAHD acyltransferase BIA1-like n=1 Tax=Prosopis cineraria TaxID=364024 RepID=UPI002410ACD6|nr:BAHD acyltransferase BIA1-like [Prosopis cineraria]
MLLSNGFFILCPVHNVRLWWDSHRNLHQPQDFRSSDLPHNPSELDRRLSGSWRSSTSSRPDGSFQSFHGGALKRGIETALGKDNDQFRPSRVEVVLALIWRCAVLSHSSKTGLFKRSAMFQGVNLRPRMEPPVPATVIGNLVLPFVVMVEEEKEMELHEVVKKMRKGMKEFIEKKARKFKEGDGVEAVMEFLKERGEMMKKKKEETVVYKCSSWCRSALYDVDYGWGNPVWMSSVNKMVSNTVALLDSRDGGVEALVTLDEQEMKIFEHHQEILHYAQLNPSMVLPPSKPKPFISASL